MAKTHEAPPDRSPVWRDAVGWGLFLSVGLTTGLAGVSPHRTVEPEYVERILLVVIPENSDLSLTRQNIVAIEEVQDLLDCAKPT